MTTAHLAEWTAEDSDALDVEILVNARRRSPRRAGSMHPDHRRVMSAAAHILSDKGRNYREIADHLGVTNRTVQRWQKALAESGGEA
ncbi:helix-turn-helix domain-containing protein [Rhodococcus pyridinivorans]|uniref:helix-turn-helix domain-containing protein n=1 Tax=Rhodococcus pyridinivorans TaxID=103816 RepID=UPI000BA1F0C9|nr:helix-turn-helix domain-containing protein [Rhodococcus pyridinivorans]UVT24950.1 helix-turn-helix domain-containing protein [Rhodococcus pyridinivorans]